MKESRCFRVAGRKRNRTGDEAPIAGWQTIYCSLAMILVVLFVMLVSYSKPDMHRMMRATNSIERGTGERKAGLRDQYDLTDEKDKGAKDASGAKAEKSSDGKDIFSGEGIGSRAISTGMTSLKKVLADNGAEESVTVEKTHRGFKAVFKSTALFPSGVATVDAKSYPYLDEIVNIAQKSSFSIKVEGHTDNVPVSLPKFPSNWELSTSRAVNVLRYLLEKGGIPAERLTAVGFGQYRPIVSNDTPEGREKNRRIEIVLELDKT